MSNRSIKTQTTPAARMHLEEELTLLKLIRGDEGRVIYRWNLSESSFAWSMNHGRVLPMNVDGDTLSEADWIALIHPEDRQIFMDAKESIVTRPGHFSVDYRLLTRDGGIIPIRHMGASSPAKAPRPTHIIGVIETSNPVKTMPQRNGASAPGAMSSRMRHYYPEDFVHRLEDSIIACVKEGTTGTLLIVSLSNLALIINSFGHDSAEMVLIDLHEKLMRLLSPQDIVQRIGRDQFGIILHGCTKAEVQAIAEGIYTGVREYGATSPVGHVHVTCTIVSVDFPEHAKTCMEVLDKAYIAQHSSQAASFKKFGDMQEETMQSRQQMGLANYLHRAIHENRLRLAFQPVIESKTGHISHYEALLRLIGEEGKISSAGALIPIAERMGLIDDIDLLVLEMVVKELLATPSLTLAFNVSNMTTDNEKWLGHFQHLMKKHPEVAARMIVEITETAAQRDLRRTAFFVASIQAAGAMVALDDFGSGYTSFRQLKALSVDMVKIDGAFVKDLVDNVDNRFFVKTLLDFTNGFGLKSVAEFVESGEAAKMLMELGVHFMQGYYFGKPENYRGWLKDGQYDKS